MPRLSEKALRRPDFDEDGVKVRLCDGNEWVFPRPWMEICPIQADGNGHVAMGGVFTMGADFDDDLDRVDAALEIPLASMDEGAKMEGGRELIESMFQLASTMLRRNYDLDGRHLGMLLRWKPEEPRNPEMWQEILGVARGLDSSPKPSAVGSGSSSSPTGSESP